MSTNNQIFRKINILFKKYSHIHFSLKEKFSLWNLKQLNLADKQIEKIIGLVPQIYSS